MIENTKQIPSQFVLDLASCSHFSSHVYVKDVSGIYLGCNELQAKNHGLSACGHVAGRCDKDFFNDADYGLIHYNDIMVIENAESKVVIESGTFPNSDVKATLSFKNPIKNSSGKVIALFGVSIALDDVSLSEVLSIQDISLNNINKKMINVNSWHEPTSKKISKRERECLEYLMMGMTAKEIARSLNLSPRTIEFYIENMKKKFGCRNRTELVAKALDYL